MMENIPEHTLKLENFGLVSVRRMPGRSSLVVLRAMETIWRGGRTVCNNSDMEHVYFVTFRIKSSNIWPSRAQGRITFQGLMGLLKNTCDMVGSAWVWPVIVCILSRTRRPVQPKPQSLVRQVDS